MHLPVGVSDFSLEGYLYVDKSLLIKALIGDSTPIIVLTHRRWSSC